MAALQYEELLPAFSISGNAVVEEQSAGILGITGPFTPNNNIQCGQAWRVRIDFATTGWLNYLMAGNIELKVMLERMGVGEFHLAGAAQTLSFVSAPNAYSTTIDISAAQSAAIPPGVYKVVATLAMKGNTGFYGPIAAFSELDTVHFYKVGL
jgi:urease beta subunit